MRIICGNAFLTKLIMMKNGQAPYMQITNLFAKYHSIIVMKSLLKIHLLVIRKYEDNSYGDHLDDSEGYYFTRS